MSLHFLHIYAKQQCITLYETDVISYYTPTTLVTFNDIKTMGNREKYVHI